jgi:hypothetical protein
MPMSLCLAIPPASRRAAWRSAMLIAGLLAACAPELQPSNPFAGTWATPERQQIAFRDDTVVMRPPGEPPTPLSAASCDGRFRFGYTRRSRDALLALTPRQADLRRRLADMLAQPDYPVAELACGEGGTTYVMVDERDLVAIHRDRDIAGIEHLSRP